MYTTDFKELLSLYFDKVADAENFDDVAKVESSVYEKFSANKPVKEQDNILSLLADVESAFEQQGFIRGYQIAMRIAIEVMQGAIEEKERVCV